ncbi:MAG: helix-turn-helix domain-containing protein [Bacillota bacterium]|nr:helix-turn-helix domain-containing protein [Bacillota bacterium]
MQSDPRLWGVYSAASHLFIKRGYAATHVSDIAEAAGIATGSVYNLFSGKKAVLHYVVHSTLLGQPAIADPAELPIPVIPELDIAETMTQKADALFKRLKPPGQVPIPFGDMLEVLFDCIASYQVAFNLINKNPDVLPHLHEQYQQYMKRLYRVTEECLRHGIADGAVRPVCYPELHVRNILEDIAWWAMLLPYEEVSVQLSVEVAREAALDTLRHAYLVRPC